MAKIKVTAGAGRTVPLHSSVATAPGARTKMLVAPEVIEVDDANLLVQRSLSDGDLVRVQGAGETVTKEAQITGGGPPATFGDLPEIEHSEPAVVKTAAPKES